MANKLTDEKLKSGKNSWFGHSKPVDWQDVSQTLCLLAEPAGSNHQQVQQQRTEPGSNQQALTSRVPAPAPIPQPPGGMQQSMPDVQQMQAIVPPVEPQHQAQSSSIVPVAAATAQQGAPAAQRTVTAGQPANGVGQQQLPQSNDQSALAVVGGQRTR
ncbi:hypothetical protein FOZ61_008573 [Perkinsus olseni]|uniref:Uncharacterized protein n=1 Tax=Perkinsus olseni TaxID=32597 RepID=A0A7J6L3C0_PEROL|nr:hypothetical protein FOZ61_008573 [Perkinsus olseni]KAF4663450.1 hypothetical protein FOL46_004734 [Perkinsus olseni]